MKFAIVESGGKQYRAVEGGTLEVDRLPVEAGAAIKLEQVLLLADGDAISVGTPLVNDTPIWTTVIEHFKGPKVNTFNYSPKKRIRVKIGHRQNYTRLRVEQIGGSSWVKKEPVKTEKAVEAETEKVEKKSRTAPRVEAKAAETKAANKAAPRTASKPAPKTAGRASSKQTKPAAKKPAGRTPTKTTSSAKEKKPAASTTKKTTSAKAEPKKKTPAASPKGKKPAAKK